MKDDIEVTSLTYDQMFQLSVKVSKENKKLEKSITDLKDYVEFLENSNKILGEEISSIWSESFKSNKWYSCESLKNRVTNFHETLGKFTKGKDKLNLILSSQKASFL